jgi:hypothetical protein
MALGYALDTASFQTQALSNERVILWTFLLVTLVGVIIAWWREAIGGLILTIVGTVALVMFMLTNKPEDYWITLVTGVPFLVSGILYLKCWRRIKSKTSQDIPNKENDAICYCPKSKAQYREVFFKCSDCGVQLEIFKRISH